MEIWELMRRPLRECIYSLSGTRGTTTATDDGFHSNGINSSIRHLQEQGIIESASVDGPSSPSKVEFLLCFLHVVRSQVPISTSILTNLPVQLKGTSGAQIESDWRAVRIS